LTGKIEKKEESVMKKDNVIQEKSYKFAIRIVRLYKYLVDKKKEYELSRQIVKCGTSIGANVEEAIGAQSDKDFISKINIAYKEARETHYWLRLLRDTDFLEANHAASMINDCEELLRILGTILKTMKEKQGGELGIKNEELRMRNQE
jgi:four helix bundle protein